MKNINILLFVITLLSLSFKTFSQTTYVPDDNFEQALIDLGYDSGPLDNYVLTPNISSLTYLSINNKNISDLTGIEDFEALQTLYCYENNLTSINTTKNIHLKKLACSSNNITSLDVTSNLDLIELYVSENNLSSIDVSNNVILNYLDLSSNNLTSLDVLNNINLTYLHYDSNSLTNVDTSNNLNLEELICANNPLSSLDVSKNINLITLICSLNNLTSIDISANVSLTDLDCGRNQLTSIDVSANLDLKHLQCDTNLLTSIDISNNINLEYLNCLKNNLTNLDLSSNLNLTNLDCSSNNLTGLNLSHNINLTRLDCRKNSLTSLDVKNGNNNKFTYFYASSNPNLNCINVDDTSWSTLNWTNIDAQTSFSENCSINNDIDNDGIINNLDLCPNTPTGETVDANGCSGSQLDDDKDGVMNDKDICPNTPAGKTVNTNGCSDSQKDDDKDGVMNDKDVCPNTPTGETVNTNGCSDSQKDDDEDGVMNDKDQCPNTPTGETINTNGCSGSQLDDDEDGVMNDKDQCPNSQTGTTVNTTGCFSLTSDNFIIEIISETCLGKNNGQISIIANETQNYEVTIAGKEYNFINNLTVDGLMPSSYEFCIAVTGEDYEQCYTIKIAEGATILGKASVSSNKVSIDIEQGTAPFSVFINNEIIFLTNSSSFSVDVKHGDLVQVKTNVTCEGVFAKTINLFEGINVYPNPSSGIFEIDLPLSQKEVIIELYNTYSQLISRASYNVEYGKVQLNLSSKPDGVYVAKIFLDNPVNVKIVKK